MKALVLLVALAACVAAFIAQTNVKAVAAQPAPAHPDGALLSKYCYTCHDSKSRAGGLALDAKDITNVGADAETWEKVIRKLRAGAMPPVGRPRPDQQTTDAFVEALESQLDRQAALHPNPGRTQPLHRLNRAEYKNAIRDLLALDIDAASLLPPDDAAEEWLKLLDHHPEQVVGISSFRRGRQTEERLVNQII